MNINDRYHLSFKNSFGNYFLSPTQQLISKNIFPIIEHLMKFAHRSTDKNIGLAQLDFWRQELAMIVNHQLPSHPLMKSLYEIHTKHLLPLSSLFQFLDAIEWKLNEQTLLTNQDFTQFCSKLSSFWIVIFYSKNMLKAQELFMLEQLRLYMTKIRLAQWIGLDYHDNNCLIPEQWEEPGSSFIKIVHHLLDSAQEHQDNIKYQLRKKGKLPFANLVFFQEHLKVHQLLKENINVVEKNFIKASYRTQIESLIQSSFIYVQTLMQFPGTHH
jgi:hypothetical protein